MKNTDPNPSAEQIQYARAAHLRDLFEPWSLRRLEARTGLGRGTLQGRLNGTTAITLSDIEVLAPVVRMTPEQLFAELLSVSVNAKKGPSSEENGPRKLPDLDSNQEPTGSLPALTADGTAPLYAVDLSDIGDLIDARTRFGGQRPLWTPQRERLALVSALVP